MNSLQLQASYPCGNFSDTSGVKFLLSTRDQRIARTLFQGLYWYWELKSTKHLPLCATIRFRRIWASLSTPALKFQMCRPSQTPKLIVLITKVTANALHCARIQPQTSLSRTRGPKQRAVWIDLRLKRAQRICCKRCATWSSMSEPLLAEHCNAIPFQLFKQNEYKSGGVSLLYCYSHLHYTFYFISQNHT